MSKIELIFTNEEIDRFAEKIACKLNSRNIGFSKEYEDALEDMAKVICNTCGIGGCPFRHGCEVCSDKDCIERIIECFKLNIKQ